ncbi:hypothetical protein JCM10213_005145 [Rhodosporidiobolus nylandii]
MVPLPLLATAASLSRRQASAPFIVHPLVAFSAAAGLSCDPLPVTFGSSAPPFALTLHYDNGTDVDWSVIATTTAVSAEGVEVETALLPSSLFPLNGSEIVFEILDAHNLSTKSLPLRFEEVMTPPAPPLTTLLEHEYSVEDIAKAVGKLDPLDWLALAWALACGAVIALVAMVASMPFLVFAAALYFYVVFVTLPKQAGQGEAPTQAAPAASGDVQPSDHVSIPMVVFNAEDSAQEAATEQPRAGTTTTAGGGPRGDFQPVSQSDEDSPTGARRSLGESEADTEELQELLNEEEHLMGDKREEKKEEGK